MVDNDAENIKKLEAENAALAEKNKNLAKVIEISATSDNTSPKDASPLTSELSKAMEELKSSMKIVKKDLKESIKGPTEKHEEMKKIVADLTEKTKDLEKIPAIVTQISDIEKKMSERGNKDKIPFGGLFGGLGTQGEGNIGMPRDAPKNMKELLGKIGEIKDGVETRLLNMERRVDTIRQKIGKKNLERLDSLVSAQQDISDNLVPRRVKEEVDKILSTLSFEVEGMSSSARELSSEVTKSNEQIADALETTKALEERMQRAELSNDKIFEIIKPVSDLADTIADIQRDISNIKEKTSSLSDLDERMSGVERTSSLMQDTIALAKNLEKRMSAVEVNDKKTRDDEYSIRDILKRLENVERLSAVNEEKDRQFREDVSRLNESVDGMHKTIGTMESDYRMKNVLREELSRMAVASRPKKRVTKSKSKQINQPETKQKPNPQEKRQIEKSIKNVDDSETDHAKRIQSTIESMEQAYSNGLITKVRYDKIIKKLRKLQGFR